MVKFSFNPQNEGDINNTQQSNKQGLIIEQNHNRLSFKIPAQTITKLKSEILLKDQIILQQFKQSSEIQEAQSKEIQNLKEYIQLITQQQQSQIDLLIIRLKRVEIVEVLFILYSKQQSLQLTGKLDTETVNNYTERSLIEELSSEIVNAMSQGSLDEQSNEISLYHDNDKQSPEVIKLLQQSDLDPN